MLGTKAVLAIIIFICTYALIITEKVQRTIIALFGAMLMIVLGILTQEQAITHIDFNTIGLLTGMMIIVNITAETGLFNYLAIWAAKKVKADPIRLLVVLSALTAICSAFLDNVTTVLLTVPVTFSITAQLKLPVYPYLVAQILAANIGGTATLIGDPPNIMIGSAVKHLDFMSFLTNLAPICLLIFAVTIAILILVYRKQFHTCAELKKQVMNLDEHTQLRRPVLMKKCLFVLFVTVVGFMFHSKLGLESATIAMSGACLLMLISMHAREKIIAKVLSRLEWLAIFFFAGLFMLVGGLVETGVIKMLAEKVMSFTQGDLKMTSMLIIWISSLASSFVDNIPFVATMIPLIKDMGSMGMTNLDPLWWSLSLGACLGGNGTIVGASANVVVIGMASQHGRPIKFLEFMKLAFPLMILSIIMSSIYIYIRYLL
ncbi:ArsB/NhaD family transporter [Pectinatus sottacetonis]|uniref:SLC13 family permease n=1 Tax=Pectinatus sottacetonis TaxID=1002795 RepID=UPI0018C74463|nr:ArsB/NhaD family transporter [Pectinatus sottacetonis]